jgi:hypothetical protein
MKLRQGRVLLMGGWDLHHSYMICLLNILTLSDPMSYDIHIHMISLTHFQLPDQTKQKLRYAKLTIAVFWDVQLHHWLSWLTGCEGRGQLY